MTNTIDNNQIVTYGRAADGTLTQVDAVSTGGNGIGTDLDTQGGLQLSSDHRFLYAVNAGSDNVSVFAVNGPSLTLLQVIGAGDEPNSLTLHGDLLYVLNGSVAANGIRGFGVGDDGTLVPLANSVEKLSSPIAVPGQVQFSPDGTMLLVTEKTTNTILSPQNAIDVFSVGADGLASSVPLRDASHGVRPFGATFRSDGTLVVAESFNATPNDSAASSYQLSSSGALNVIAGSVSNAQTDSCWIILTGDGRYAFTANFGSGTISSYSLDAGGALHLINGAAASLGDMSQPVDLGMSADSQYLYLLLRGTGGVASFQVSNGNLTPLGVVVGGLPVGDGASGLASF